MLRVDVLVTECSRGQTSVWFEHGYAGDGIHSKTNGLMARS